MPTTDATTRGVDMRRRSSSLVAMTREALLLATLGVLTLSFVQSDSTPSEPSCVRSTTDAGSGSCPSDAKFARIVAIPDIHGDLHHYRESLSLAGVATEDAPIEWTAGDTTHLVQTGDIVDRGEHSLLIMDMLANLTTRARKAGGKVTALMGNHELMSGLMDDTRYVNKEEILLMGRKELDAMRELGGERMGTSYGISAAWQTGTRAWIKAFDPDAKRGRRLRDRRPMATVAGEGFCTSLFAHAGVRSRHLARHGDGIDTLNEAARVAIQGKPDVGWLHHHDLYDNESPVWNRFYSRDGADGEICAEVERVLAAVGANRMVIGHTVQMRGMRAKCGGKLHLIDVGISSAYVGRGAAWSCEDGKVRAHYAGRVEVLEEEEGGGQKNGEKATKKGWW